MLIYEFMPNKSLDFYIFDPLGREMNPKISDFGMAKAFTKDECEANTGRIVGTYGYVPPEYVRKVSTFWNLHISCGKMLWCSDFGNCAWSKEKLFRYNIRGNRVPSKLCMEKMERRDSFECYRFNFEGRKSKNGGSGSCANKLSDPTAAATIHDQNSSIGNNYCPQVSSIEFSIEYQRSPSCLVWKLRQGFEINIGSVGPLLSSRKCDVAFSIV
ncbi:hypothetical protein Q3G72_002728 [Acer saccharum]|nr:hypothetical protein Q3G72_002728 [Acer saccharum]